MTLFQREVQISFGILKQAIQEYKKKIDKMSQEEMVQELRAQGIPAFIDEPPRDLRQAVEDARRERAAR